MNHNLQEIFKAITPDNIKDIPAIRDSMQIFIEILEERSKQSIDLSTYTENKQIRNELFKTYLGDLYRVLDGIKDNQKLIDLITERNELYDKDGNYDFISREVLENMLDRISDEHFVAFRNFREKKGTIKGIEYIFHLIASLINTPDGIDYVIIEGDRPFGLAIEGTLPPDFYYYLIAPLAHPAGFTYNYAQVIAWELVDYFFPIERIYTVRQLEVNCVTTDPNNPGVDIKKTIDYSDRTVIDIKEESYVWPKRTRIYFGGIHEGEYLENLRYANGDSTVELKDSTGVIKTFGEYCTISRIIESIIIQDPEIDSMISQLIIDFGKDSYNDIWDAETGTLIPSDDSIVDDSDYDHAVIQSEVGSPYLSWDKVKFWDLIGSTPLDFKWNKGNPDSFINTEISQLGTISGSGKGLVNPDIHLIGADYMHIWAKHEYTSPQSLNETISEDILPVGLNKGVDLHFGITEFNNKETILSNPGNPRLSWAHISGDAYHIDYNARSTEIEGFIVADSIESFIIPDVFELEASPYIGSDYKDTQTKNITFDSIRDNFGIVPEGTNADVTIRVNSFNVLNNEYSYTLFDDMNHDNIHRFMGVEISPEWEISSVLTKGYVLGDEIPNRINRWGIPFLGDSDFFLDNLGTFHIKENRLDNRLYNSYGNHHPEIKDYILGEYEIIGGTDSDKLPHGFWTNGFHQESDEFEFGVFRDGQWIPDNNVNQPVDIIFEDKYATTPINLIGLDEIGSIGDQFIKPLTYGEVFGEDSDTLGEWETSSTSIDDYEQSFEDGNIIRAFSENSDRIIFEQSYQQFLDDYSITYDKDLSIGKYEISDYFIGDKNNITVFDENSDSFNFTVGSEFQQNYGESFETYYYIGGESLGLLNELSLDVINSNDITEIGQKYNKYLDIFSENSDDSMFIGTFNSNDEYVPHINFVEEDFSLDTDNYSLSFKEQVIIGDNGYLIGDKSVDPVIEPYTNEILFDENSDRFCYSVVSPLTDDYSVSFKEQVVISDNGYLIGDESVEPVIEPYTNEIVFDENSDRSFTGIIDYPINDIYSDSYDRQIIIGEDLVGKELRINPEMMISSGNKLSGYFVDMNLVGEYSISNNLLIGEDLSDKYVIGDGLINQYTVQILFDENSDDISIK